MGIWHTWLAYLGLIGGLVSAGLFGITLTRSALIGLAGGLVAVIVVNLVDSKPAPCLQESKGWDILRAYSLKCISEQELELLRNKN